MSGPPRTPTAIAEAQGNPGKRAKNALEPKLPPRAPEKPADLDTCASEEWDRLVATGLAAKVLTIAERSILELAARAYSMWRLAEAELSRRKSLTYETTNTGGSIVFKTRPEVAIASDAWRRYRAAVCELGFTPAARTKASTVDSPEANDPAAQFFN